MLSKEEIESNELARKIYRVQEHVLDEIKKNGEISYFKEDVLYIIHNLLERQLTKEEQTACEIAVKNQESRIRTEYERHMQMKIDKLESDKQKLIEKLGTRRKQNNDRYGQSIDNDEFPEMYEYGAYVKEDDYILSILKGEKE